MVSRITDTDEISCSASQDREQNDKTPSVSGSENSVWPKQKSDHQPELNFLCALVCLDFGSSLNHIGITTLFLVVSLS